MAHNVGAPSGTATGSNSVPSASAINGLFRLIAGQTAMLFAGFATAQGCAFLRNAIFAHALSRGDFGIAATILLTLQIIETLADVGSDKLIVQADDGASRKVVGTAQTFVLLRGIATGLLLVAIAYPLADFYRVPEAAIAFMCVGLAPLMRGFINLDMRRAQRALNNRPYMMVEVLPQVIALVATPFAVWWSPTFSAVVLVSLIQAGATLLVSHLASRRRVEFVWHTQTVWRMLAFSWPIWASALPVVIVYHGDRVLIGRLLDMHAVAGFSAAFLVTMVPGLIAAKVGNAILLPLLSSVKHDRAIFRSRLRLMIILVSALAAVYAAVFALLGGPLLTLAFGSAYGDLGLVVMFLAAAWALRMLQTVPGVALMAIGRTQVLLQNGMVRALGLIPAYFAITQGYGIEGVAAAAAIAELWSLAFMIWRTQRLTASR